ncbi:hypothetical protein B0F90DRAFT_1924274 [Multifurca ochricompacta]|uniref:Uncharacterized protein n=1 Tax=Multifurca ochricompacta TaxID=376703 RepID=A0AAD4QQL8_9AGAM|nr:hypothetical protein B0F90DRAFT_1924274 [Multifurca ochricompacta]
MLAMFAIPHSSSSRSPGGSDTSQPWSKVRAWISRERNRAGRLLQVALGAARAASASTNVVTPTARRTAIENVVWDNRPEAAAAAAAGSRSRDTQPTMFDWVNVHRVEEHQKKVDGALPVTPPQTETTGRIYSVKRKPVPSLEGFHDELLHPSHHTKTAGSDDEKCHEVPYTWPVAFTPLPHHQDFQDNVSDQEDSDQDSYDQETEYMRGDSESEVNVWDRGLLVAEMCNRWGWTLEDVLETLEQPGLEGRRKCSREKGVLRA